MNFASDNIHGVDEAILAAIGEANQQLAAPSYAADAWSERACDKLNEVFERKVDAFLVPSGTAANGLALSTIARPYNAILCHVDAHINADECGSPELLTGGAKLYGISDVRGKLSVTSVEAMLDSFVRGERNCKPSALSITQASELGTVYSPNETAAICDLAHSRDVKVHMDGARFTNALVAQDCTPADLTWKAGIDVMSFGATKNGALALEAVIFFDTSLAADFGYRRLRGGQLLSKGRYLGAQMEAYLTDDLWLRNARHANAEARRLADGLAAIAGVRVPLNCESNQVFPIMPRAMFEHLLAAGAMLYKWPGTGPGIDQPGEDEVFARLVTSFATRSEDVDALIDTAKSA